MIMRRVLPRFLLLVVSAGSATALADEVRVPAPQQEPAASRRAPPSGGAPLMPRQPPIEPVPPPPPAPPVQPPEIAAVGKTLAGTWTCKGSKPRGDGSSASMVAKLTIKLDLDGAWVQASFVESGAGGAKLTSYRTFDPVAKQWTLVQVTNAGGHAVSTSAGETGGAWTWTGTSNTSAGSTQTRDHEQRDGKQLKVWGEALLGGAWQKTYEATCSK